MTLDIFKRQCGECTACCTAIAVKELGKPFNRACNLLGKKGCSVYGKHPDSCAGYQCVWLTGLGEWGDRPDKLGAVFHVSMTDGGLWVTVFLLEDKVPEQRILKLAVECLSLGPEIKGVRFVDHNHVLNVDFPVNLKEYPGGGNIGSGTSWLQYRDNPFYYLEAPRRISLPVLTDV